MPSLLLFLCSKIFDLLMPGKLPQHHRDYALDADIDTTTKGYYTILLHHLQNADDPIAEMECLKVTRLKHVKQKLNLFQHEYLAVEVVIGSCGESICFQIERLQDRRPRTIQDIAHDKDEESVELLKELRNGNLPEDAKPLLSPDAAPSADSTTTSDVLSPTPVIPRLTFWEGTSLASVTSLHTMKSRLKDPFPAYDRIRRIQSFETPPGEKVLDEISPKNLNFLQLLLFTNLVHEKDQFYSLFNHQCFWFSNLILQCVGKKFGNGSSLVDPDFDAKRQDGSVFLTRSALVQSANGQLFVKGKEAGWEAGTWMKFLVAPIEVLLVNRVIGDFDLLWGEEEIEMKRWTANKFDTRVIEADREAIEADREAIEADREAIKATRKAFESEKLAFENARKALEHTRGLPQRKPGSSGTRSFTSISSIRVRQPNRHPHATLSQSFLSKMSSFFRRR